jgi:hypothetical protein
MSEKMKNQGNQADSQQRIRKIRESISGLERIRDEIIAYLATRKEPAENLRRLWTADLKECHYSIVAAWQLLSTGSQSNSPCQESAGNFLKAAQSRMAQVWKNLLCKALSNPGRV